MTTGAGGLLDGIDEMLVVRLYGKPVTDVTITGGGRESALSRLYAGAPIAFAWIHGVRAMGKCHTLPHPMLLLVPDRPKDPTDCGEFGDPEKFQMWELPADAQVATLDTNVVSVTELVPSEVRLEVHDEFRIHGVRVEDGVLRGRVRAYLRLRQPGPFGTTIFNITVVDRDDAFEINLKPDVCIPVFSIGVASAEVCFRPNPDRICGSVSVSINLPVLGHYARRWDLACVNV
jgi:hypothetical protein